MTMKYNKITTANMTEKQADEQTKAWSVEGNIPAALHLILHNQGVLNEKLDRLLKTK